jgi:D-alanine transaminase
LPRQAYVNGRFLPHRNATVHIEDRGYQFADGVYEVVPLIDGILVDEDLHLDRLERSLAELSIAQPCSRPVLKLIARELMRRNGLSYGILYFQVTRGVAPRDHKFPKGARPALVMTTKQMKPHSDKMVSDGLKVITLPDQRWDRCDIKSISLLPNVLAKEAASEAGAYEAWQVDDQGMVTEGSSTNAWIVTNDNTVVTRQTSQAILNGITRISLIEVIKKNGYSFEERPFSVEEAKTAREAFITSSTSFVLPVTQIDDVAIGNGHAGFLTCKLRSVYINYMRGADDQ